MAHRPAPAIPEGLSIVKKTFRREVEGCRFFSITIRGHKFEKKECHAVSAAHHHLRGGGRVGERGQ
jgi:hypothetical protein